MAPTAPVSMGFYCHAYLPKSHVQGSSDRERLSAHAEVLSLQERLGISYKDASHRLYMAEMERMKADEKTFKAFASLEVTTKKALEKALNSLKELDKDCTEEMNTT